MRRFGLFVLLSLSFWGGDESARAADGRKLKVLTSVLPLYCFTANVAGDLADVENLLPARVEPHDYQFSRKDLRKLAGADLIVVNGLGLERWLERSFRNDGPERLGRVLTVSAGLNREIIYAPRAARQGAMPNPHFWLDPHLACLAVTNILNALAQADPARAAGYASNALRYAARLEALDASLGEALAPLRGAPLVTYHDAFPYFARRYGLRIAGVIEPSPEVEPSLKYLAALYGSIREDRVQAIFTEPMERSRLAEQIGSDLRLPVASLDTLETGSMDPGAYEEGMRNNARVLLKYLQPNAP